MRKEELISALVSSKRGSLVSNGRKTSATNSPRAGQTTRGASAANMRSAGQSDSKASAAKLAPPPSAASQRIKKRLAELHRNRHRLHDISTITSPTTGSSPEADRLLLLVRDAYWIHLSWEIQPATVRRAQTALGQFWHSAEPVIRLHRLHPSGASAGYQQVTIHGGVNHWYINVQDPPGRYRAEIGYATPGGNFYGIAKSNEATTPTHEAARSLAAQSMDDNWTDVARNADRIYAMSGGYSADGVSPELQEALEGRLRRRLGRPTETRLGPSGPITADNTLLELTAEMVVHGHVAPHTHLTVQGEPVEVSPEGQFAVRVAMPDRRQVIPVVASSADGVNQKTVILGIEKNTKTLSPPRRENGVL
ncbi:hypothetical protein Pla111_06240 [Botrimarina hoheduenensis]|uniref:DUF4912 domain-containing protein n=2 Tax=Botrimarina hoheduenensis TaxID=2528000 RepID=A0A5C5WD91_9BACT|nr:hypothetical protein Pla111_06240 [Botrimarina hoheduenensis]